MVCLLSLKGPLERAALSIWSPPVPQAITHQLYNRSVTRLRTIIGASLLLFQLGMIGYARFVPARYFCWAPYDIQSEYRIDVLIGGRPLTASQIRARYRRPRQGV